jgi:hypothetical protein
MLILEAAMALLVAAYYSWPAAADVLSRFGAWEHRGGVLAAALATALAGGLLSQLSRVYFQDGGRWTATHVENAAFNLGLFFISGTMVYEFYQQQARWFGNGTAWSILVPKILLDQFGFTVLWSTPYQSLMTRWHTLRYSWPRLWRELDRNFIAERMLPILVTNWMFWLPGVTLIYSLPLNLQTSLFIFATAIWGLLLPAVVRQSSRRTAVTLTDLVPPGPEVLPQAAD